MSNENCCSVNCDNPLDQSYWESQYQTNNLGWDIGKVATPIQEYIDTIEDKKIRILIPGCGNSYEAAYLLHKGFTNVTVIDIAPSLIQNLKNTFSNNPNITIVLGDFFEHQGEYDLIKSWARKPYLSPEDKVMESWDWFSPWFIDLLKTPSFQIAFFLFFFGIIGVIYFNAKTKQQTKAYLSEIALPATLSFIGILFWFGMAPAPRFGLAFIYGLSVLLFSVTIQTSGILNHHQRQSPMMLLMIIIVACLPIAQRMHFSKETWIFLPKHPVVKTEIQSTLENEEMMIPKENPLCWNSTLPCVAVFNPELRVKKKPGARLPYQFYFGEDFKKAGENYAKLRESI